MSSETKSVVEVMSSETKSVLGCAISLVGVGIPVFFFSPGKLYFLIPLIPGVFFLGCALVMALVNKAIGDRR